MKTRQRPVQVLGNTFLMLFGLLACLPGLYFSYITAEGRFVYLGLYLGLNFVALGLIFSAYTLYNRAKTPHWRFQILPAILLIGMGAFSSYLSDAGMVQEWILASYLGLCQMLSGHYFISLAFTFKARGQEYWTILMTFAVTGILTAFGIFLYPLFDEVLLSHWTLFGFAANLNCCLSTMFLVYRINRDSRNAAEILPTDRFRREKPIEKA